MQPELSRAMSRIPFTFTNIKLVNYQMNISRILLKSEGSTVLILHATLWLCLGFIGLTQERNDQDTPPTQKRGEGILQLPWNRRYRPTGAPKLNLKSYPYSSAIHL